MLHAMASANGARVSSLFALEHPQVTASLHGNLMLTVHNMHSEIAVILCIGGMIILRCLSV